VLLVRHGVTASTGIILPDEHRPNLSERGVAQAERVAERLDELPRGRRSTCATGAHARNGRPIARALRLRAHASADCSSATSTLDREEVEPVAKKPSGAPCRRPSTFRFPEGESFTEMHSDVDDAGANPASTQPHDYRREPRRSIKAPSRTPRACHWTSSANVISTCSISAIDSRTGRPSC